MINFKMLFPSYRNRYLFISEQLMRLASQKKLGMVLHAGCGEGDYDPMISQYAVKLISCDINQEDVEYASTINQEILNITYEHQDVTALEYKDESFDLIIAAEVIEHISDPWKLLQESQRTLKTEGLLLLTFPQNKYPFTYDPINRLVSLFSKKHFSIGAYAFGHEKLIDFQEFKTAANNCGLEIIQIEFLSGYLIGIVEMYWTGIVQSIFKQNAANSQGLTKKNSSSNNKKFRPGRNFSIFQPLTDSICQVDKWISGKGKNSIGIGVILRKIQKHPA